jgi:ubiquitin C-terminal hydrolase
MNEGDKENWDQVAEKAGMHKILQTLETNSDGDEPVLTSVSAGGQVPDQEQINSLPAIVLAGTPIREVLPQDIGFPNPPGSNRCWMNATLQMLLGMEPFMEELEFFCLRRDQNNRCEVLQSFFEVMKYRRWRRRLSLRSALRHLFHSLGMLDAMFLSDRQQDAAEFLLCLLDLFREQLCSSKTDLGLQDIKAKESCTLRELQLENLPSGSSAMQRLPSGGRLGADSVHSPVCDNIEFCLKEIYCCTNCSESTTRCQDHLALFLDIPPTSNVHPSLQEALSHYMQSDIRELKCGKCSGQRSKVETVFARLPRFLLVQVKRYTVQTAVTEKLRSLLRVPISLSLKNCVADNVVMPVPWSPQRAKECDTSQLSVDEDEEKELQEVMCQSVEEDLEVQDLEKAIKLSLEEQQLTHNKDCSFQLGDADVPMCELEGEDDSPDHSYRLICVLMHQGLSLDCGHYVADVYNIGQQQWYHYDDEVVSYLAEGEVLGSARQRNGYIFCYMHRHLFNQLLYQNRNLDTNC